MCTGFFDRDESGSLAQALDRLSLHTDSDDPDDDEEEDEDDDDYDDADSTDILETEV